MPPHFYLLHLHSNLVSTTGNAAKIARNTFLFGALDSTPDPNIEESQRQILLSVFSSLKDPEPSIAWYPYQSPSVAPPISSLLSIARTKNYNPLLRLISCHQSDSNNPCTTVRISVLSAFMRTSYQMLLSVFTVGDIDFIKTVFSQPIYHILSA